MLELIGNYNIFALPQTDTEGMCITTNGVLKKAGTAVMGKGIALQANNLFNLSTKLGQYIKQYGNRVFNMGKYSNNSKCFNVITFPTKHHWKEPSDITLICKSCEQLVALCNKFGITKCYLPPVGCGCGNLDYKTTVKPQISQILDDRFIIVLSQTKLH